MGYTQVHTDLMFSALDYFLGSDTPSLVFRDELGISFETVLGNYGLVVPNEEGNWDVIVNKIKVYEIEDEVYSIITHEGNSPFVEEYMEKLKRVYNLDLKEKSKNFVSMTMKGLEFLAIHGKINLRGNFSSGPFFAYDGIDGFKKRIILN